MSFFDITLAVILAAFTLNGLFKGLIRLLGRMVGLIIGAFVASHYYLLFFSWSKGLFGNNEAVGKTLAFVVLFVVATLLVDLVFMLLEKAFNLISIIPFTKLINRLLGGALGFLEGSLFLGLILYVISRYAWLGSLFGDRLVNSQIAPLLLKIVKIILPVLPEAMKTLQALI